MEEAENWKERLQQFKKEQIIKSEPEDYIHVGLDASCQYSTLEHFIRIELESEHREGYELGLKAAKLNQ